MKPASEAVKKSRAHAGVTTTSVSLAPDERALWDRLAEQHGGRKAALMAGLRALEGEGERSKAALLAEIERRLT